MYLGIRNWIEGNFSLNDDEMDSDDSVSQREALVADLSNYICSPSDELSEIFKNPEKYRAAFDPVDPLWEWLKYEICENSYDIKPWRRFHDFETFSVRRRFL